MSSNEEEIKQEVIIDEDDEVELEKIQPSFVTEVKFERTEEDDINDLLNLEESERNLKAPEIDHLIDAITYLEGDPNPLFLPEVGDYVIIERYTNIGNTRYWLDTTTFKVIDVNEVTGNLKLWDDNKKQQAMSNYITGPTKGLRFKLPPGNSGRKLSDTKVKRGRKKKVK